MPVTLTAKGAEDAQRTQSRKKLNRICRCNLISRLRDGPRSPNLLVDDSLFTNDYALDELTGAADGADGILIDPEQQTIGSTHF